MIQGAIFDADGTLLDSMGMWDTVGERYLISQGVRPPAGLRETLFPLSLAQCAVYLKDRFALPLAPSAIEAGINGVIRSFYAGEVVAKAGVLDFLRGLKAKGVPLYLATATDREVITKGLERTGILPLLDGLVTCGDLGVDKRTPEIFDYARDQMGTATAAAAGYPVAGVADPYSDQTELRKLSRIYLPDMTDFSGFYQRATR